MTSQTRHPQTIIDYTQFKNTMFQVGVIYDDSDTPSRICRYEYREDGWYRCTMDEYPDGDRTVPQDPSHFPLRLVSEPAPTPVEPTDEQRAAWLEIKTYYPLIWEQMAPLLPDALTNPVPARPTEPGHYEDENGRHWLHQVYDGKGDHPNVYQWLNWGGQTADPPAVLYRLVRERRPVTRLQIVQAGGNLQDWQTEALLKLANGTPDE